MRTMVDDLIAIEDKKFTDAVDAVIEHDRKMRERRRWRDGKGVVHALARAERINLTTLNHEVGEWAPICGRRYESTVQHDPALPVTCLTCLVKD